MIKKPEFIKMNKEFSSYLNSEKLAALAFKRGFDSLSELQNFIDLESYSPLDINDFPDIDKAADYILEYINQDKKILVYGDYDVDGITSTSILYAGFKKLSDKILYHIPDRFKEGYGLNKDVLARYQNEIDLIVTCDCGISNHEEVNYAKDLGIDIVVTDHHDLPDLLPNADFVLSPRLLPRDHQGYWLPGAGMAYFLIKAVYRELEMLGHEEEFLDLLLLAIIADVVPLTGENRYLYKTGIEKLRNTDRIGLKLLYNILDINSQEINEKVMGFKIGPVLNSAGRIDKAEKGLKLLLAEDDIEAAGTAAELKEINQRRKEISQKIYLEAEKEMLDQERKGLVYFNSEWHQGVIGIAAGRIAENFRVPAVLMTENKSSGLITGSARSVEGIDINKLISSCSELLEKHGGHAAAAGFSLKKDRLEKFKLRLQRLIDEEMSKKKFVKSVEPELNLKISDIEDEFYQKMRLFAPFGEQNPEPLFYTEARILSIRNISQGKHKKLILADGESRITALWWWADEIEASLKHKAAFKLSENIYQGRHSLQLEIEALEPLAAEDDKEKTASVKSNRFKQIEIIDFREKELEEIESGRENTVYFAESRHELGFYPLINREYQQRADELLLLTIPASQDILKEMLILSGAEKIIISGAVDEIKSVKEFINLVMGLIKYIINKKNGVFDINKASVFLSEEEITVKRGIEYLAAEGMLTYEYVSYHELLITKGGSPDKGLARLRLKQLQKLLKESASFRRFFIKKGCSEIEKLINNILNTEMDRGEMIK